MPSSDSGFASDGGLVNSGMFAAAVWLVIICLKGSLVLCSLMEKYSELFVQFAEQAQFHLTPVRKEINAILSRYDAFSLVLASVFLTIVLQHVLSYLSSLWKRIRREGLASIAIGMAMKLAALIPSVARMIQAEKDKALQQIREHAVPKRASSVAPIHQLPSQGIPRQQVLKMLEDTKKVGGGGSATFSAKRAFGGIYSRSAEDDAEAKFVVDSFATYASTNALYPGLWPGLRRFETEVVSMVAHMLHGDDDTVGVMTSGGTESILLAIKAYRDQARHERGITQPQLICCDSAHAAFAKACEFFNIEYVTVGVTEDQRMDVAATRRAITSNTIAIIASAPCFPHGVVDPIPELAQLAQSHGVGLHVDNCFGGFLLSYLNKIGAIHTPFDFAVPGVTTISCDLHKYGMATKGNSTLLYRSASLRKYQFTAVTDWSGGLFASPSMAGSRPGGLIASAWASLIAVGDDGYRKNAAIINENFQRLKKEIEQTDGLRIVGKPDCGMIAFDVSPQLAQHHKVDIFCVADALHEIGGWDIGRCQKPKCLHFPVGLRQNEEVITAFVHDLRAALARVKANPDEFKNGMAAVYGGAVAMPNRGTVKDLLLSYMDAMYRV